MSIFTGRKRATSFLLPLALLALGACDPTEATEPAFEAGPLTAAFGPGGMGGGAEYADVMNQGGIGIYAHNGGRLVRQPSGLQASMKMPLPQPGTYVYADGGIVGSPEVFTLWAFVFNYPELCSFPCSSDDLGMDKPAKGGAYNMGGHPASGRELNVGGRIAVGEPAFRWAPLEAPATAEVHLAMAPHGALDPALLPNELRIPAGNGACGCWWVSIFD